MMIGDMLVQPHPDTRMFKALAVISSVLHPAYDNVLPTLGKSKESCVLCSLTVRDFLWKIGFKHARLQTVYLALRAVDAAGEEIHSLGVGDHDKVPTVDTKPLDTRGKWSGHMVVTCGSWLIDTTVYQTARPAWPDMPGMFAVRLDLTGGPQSYGMDPLAGLQSPRDDGGVQSILWLQQPNERWRGGPDTDRALRLPVVRALRAAFG